MKKKEKIDYGEAPESPLYYYFHKWDDDYARNALIYFIKSKRLEKECESFIKQHF